MYTIELMDNGIKIFTDGSSLGNPGPGGFCAVIKKGADEFIVKGGEADTTNNRMEMSAVIAGLYWVSEKFPNEKSCEVYSDSKLVIDSLRKGWKRKKNLDLWEKMDAVILKFKKIGWNWVKGHAGHRENEMADKVAFAEANKNKKRIKGLCR